MGLFGCSLLANVLPCTIGNFFVLAKAAFERCVLIHHLDRRQPHPRDRTYMRQHQDIILRSMDICLQRVRTYLHSCTKRSQGVFWMLCLVASVCDCQWQLLAVFSFPCERPGCYRRLLARDLRAERDIVDVRDGGTTCSLGGRFSAKAS